VDTKIPGTAKRSTLAVEGWGDWDYALEVNGVDRLSDGTRGGKDVVREGGERVNG
jgi:hypothetical protein